MGRMDVGTAEGEKVAEASIGLKAGAGGFYHVDGFGYGNLRPG
jgi:hypothetical protein